MAGSETAAHVRLKQLALEWAITQGFALAGLEVRVPRSSFRADVAAATKGCAEEHGRTALFECKQSRADLLRDGADEPDVRRQASALGERVRELRTLIGAHRPDLRRGTTLFPEFDDYDFTGLRHDGLHAVETELARLQRKLLGAVKFARLHRYAPCDYLYLVTELGVVAAHEVPVQWGWLERAGDALHLRTPPTRHTATRESRLALLERIAAAGTRASRRELSAAFPSRAI